MISRPTPRVLGSEGGEQVLSSVVWKEYINISLCMADSALSRFFRCERNEEKERELRVRNFCLGR